MKNNCFAAREVKCSALKVFINDCNPKQCKFYKPDFQHEGEIEKSNLRVSKLDAVTQRQIIESYGLKAVGFKIKR